MRGSGLDFQQQILAAHISLQIDRLECVTHAVRQLGANLRQIGRVAHVYLVMQAGQIEPGLARQTICLGQHGLDIGHGFAGLCHDICGVHGCVANNTGGAGNKQHLILPQAHQAGTRKRRAARAILLRILVGTDLTRVFNVQRCHTSG